MGRPYKRITEQVFNGVKAMLKGGALQKDAAEWAGVSANTVNRIAKAESYDSYLGYAYANGRNAYPETRLQDDRQKGGTLSANYQLNRIYEMLKKQNETLVLISNKVAFIVDELCGTVKKDG